MLTPLGNHLFVEPIRRKASPGGIVFLDENYTWSGDTMEYRVLSVGPGRKLPCGQLAPIWPDITPGDIIIAGIHQSQSFELDGHQVTVMNAQDVLCVINNAPEDAALGQTAK